jgi:hypothetical protein
MKKTILITIVLAALASNAFAGYAGDVWLNVANSPTSKTDFYATGTGSYSYDGMTITWDTDNNTYARLHFQGILENAPNYQPAYLDLMWFPWSELGINLNIVSNNGAPYNLTVANNNGSSWESPLPWTTLSGNASTEFELGYSSRTDLEMYLDLNIEYDLMLEVTWGPLAVSEEVTSWGKVQAMFR